MEAGQPQEPAGGCREEWLGWDGPGAGSFLHWWALVVPGRPGAGERAAAAGATPEGLAADGEVPRSSASDGHLGSAPRAVAEGGGSSAHRGEAPGCVAMMWLCELLRRMGWDWFGPRRPQQGRVPTKSPRDGGVQRFWRG